MHVSEHSRLCVHGRQCGREGSASTLEASETDKDVMNDEPADATETSPRVRISELTGRLVRSSLRPRADAVRSMSVSDRSETYGRLCPSDILE